MKSKIVWEPTRIKYLTQTYNGKVGKIILFKTYWDNGGIILQCLLPGIKDTFHTKNIDNAKQLSKEIWKLWRNQIKGG